MRARGWVIAGVLGCALASQAVANVEFAIKTLTENCIWSVNTGFDKKRMEWHTAYSVEVGDIEADKRPTPDQVSNHELAEEAVKVAGGRKTYGKCSL